MRPSSWLSFSKIASRFAVVAAVRAWRIAPAVSSAEIVPDSAVNSASVAAIASLNIPPGFCPVSLPRWSAVKATSSSMLISFESKGFER
ncbi:MAG TPA: hypothetical protein VIM61_05840 [Chthoniobacterales bacterium]|jgi:hypothetical protein